MASTARAAEQCRFIEARLEREACYQRQETARAARQKANDIRQAAEQKPYEPMAQEDAQLAKSLRGICRGCWAAGATIQSRQPTARKARLKALLQVRRSRMHTVRA
ncbi:hypothetical protein ACF1BQ_013085 [Bradyrhizobium sp. RDT10]